MSVGVSVVLSQPFEGARRVRKLFGLGPTYPGTSRRNTEIGRSPVEMSLDVD